MAKRQVSKPEVEQKTIADLTPDPNNANRHTERGTGLLQSSIRRLGAGRSILMDKHGKIIAGNATHEAAGSVGLADVIVVKTDGTQLVAVQRTDLDLDTDLAAKELAVADNRIGEINLDLDAKVLEQLSKSGVNIEAAGVSPDELQAMLERAEPPAGGSVDLISQDALSPPVMSWVLIGIPTVRFGEIAAAVEKIAATRDVLCETVVNNGQGKEDRQSQSGDEAGASTAFPEDLPRRQ